MRRRDPPPKTNDPPIGPTGPIATASSHRHGCRRGRVVSQPDDPGQPTKRPGSAGMRDHPCTRRNWTNRANPRPGRPDRPKPVLDFRPIRPELGPPSVPSPLGSATGPGGPSGNCRPTNQQIGGLLGCSERTVVFASRGSRPAATSRPGSSPRDRRLPLDHAHRPRPEAGLTIAGQDDHQAVDTPWTRGGVATVHPPDKSSRPLAEFLHSKALESCEVKKLNGDADGPKEGGPPSRIGKQRRPRPPGRLDGGERRHPTNSPTGGRSRRTTARGRRSEDRRPSGLGRPQNQPIQGQRTEEGSQATGQPTKATRLPGFRDIRFSRRGGVGQDRHTRTEHKTHKTT